MRLEFSKKCLESQALQLRVFGIVEINNLIRDIKREKSETEVKEAIRELVEWLTNKQVFDILWHPAKTHA